jgi:hypothetical protein
MGAIRRLAFVAVACLIALSQVAQARGDSADIGEPAALSREHLIKSAILYNFAKFARWPDTAFKGPGAPLKLCVLGANPFGEALATIEGRRVGEHPLQVNLISEPMAVAGCHMLFVSASEQDRVQQVLDAIDGRPVLTVADWPGFADAGGIISLKTVDDRSRFEVNMAAAERAGLKLSAKLLRLASAVIGN